MTAKAERVRLASILRSKFPDGVPFDLIAQTETINKKRMAVLTAAKRLSTDSFLPDSPNGYTKLDIAIATTLLTLTDKEIRHGVVYEDSVMNRQEIAGLCAIRLALTEILMDQ